MTYYKDWRIIEGKPRWIIVDKTGKIVNKNPNNEELKGLQSSKLKGPGYSRSGDYNSTNTCDMCGINFDNAPGHPLREYKTDGKCAGRWICAKCYELIKTYGTVDKTEIQKIIERSGYIKPNYYNSTNTCDKCDKNFKYVIGSPLREYDKENNWTGRWLCRKCSYNSDFRNNNLDPNSDHGKGYIFEQITCGARDVKNLNIVYDDFNSQIDHDIDPELGILQTKGATFRTEKNSWNIDLRNERDKFGNLKNFDNLMVYCMDKYMKKLELAYIFPYEELINRKSITITKNRFRRISWYDQYEIDEKPYNDVYQNLKLEDCPVLRNDNGAKYVYELF